MDNKYIITPDGNFISSDELYHWGILGMKWGVRRYQNADGTLTDQGKKRYLNPDGTLNKKGKKKLGDSVKLPEKPRQKTSDEYINDELSKLSDQELMQKVIRLRQEDAYRDLSKKLGYNGPRSDMEIKIAELKQQKEYMGLQKDIRDLDKALNPTKESSTKKFMKSVMGKVVAPVATDLAKKYLSKYLGEAAEKILAKEAKDTVDKVKNSAEKVKEKEAKKAEKQAKKESRVYEDTTEKSKEKKSSNKSRKNRTVEAEFVENYYNRSTASFTSANNTSYGSSWASRYNDTLIRGLPVPNISGYLPSPKDDD